MVHCLIPLIPPMKTWQPIFPHCKWARRRDSFFYYLERPRLVHMILRNFSSLALYIRILIDELKTSEKWLKDQFCYFVTYDLWCFNVVHIGYIYISSWSVVCFCTNRKTKFHTSENLVFLCLQKLLSLCLNGKSTFVPRCYCETYVEIHKDWGPKKVTIYIPIFY